jgi:hypothetical protein
MNESFKTFVLEAESAKTIADWERPAIGRSWSDARGPFLALLGIVLVITILMIAPAIDTTMTLFAGAAGIMTAASQALSGIAGGIGSLLTKIGSWIGLGGTGGAAH